MTASPTRISILLLVAATNGLRYVPPHTDNHLSRRAICSSASVVAGVTVAGRCVLPAAADDENNSAEQIKALQEKLKALQEEQSKLLQSKSTPDSVAPPSPVVEPAIEATPATSEPPRDVTAANAPAPTGPTAFDFDVPWRGEPRDIKPFLGKRASLFVNVKTTDPISIYQMPALATIADKYAPQGLSVLAFTTDQGWFEEDNSETLRLKVKQEFNFGKYPTSVVLDKVDLIGDRALPLYSYVTSMLPNPWGVNRIVLNYEKILMSADGRPLRRYPRKYPATFMEADLQAVIAGEPLPPPSEALERAWEEAKREAIKSEYAFKAGLNYYKYGSPAS